MKVVAWPCPAPGGTGEEFALIAGPDDAGTRVLIVPALFEEANKTRRMLAEAIRKLAGAGIASVLPDLPGCNESPAPLDRQDLASWRAAIECAASHFAASHVVSVRGGALVAPNELPGWRLEPCGGGLRALLRARVFGAQEDGRNETMAALLELGGREGIELAGYRLGAAMIRDLQTAEPDDASLQSTLTLAQLGGEPLWLRGEPGEDAALSVALAGRIAAEIGE